MLGNTILPVSKKNYTIAKYQTYKTIETTTNMTKHIEEKETMQLVDTTNNKSARRWGYILVSPS